MTSEALKELIEELCAKAVEEMEKNEESQRLDKESTSIAEEIIQLRKEVAQAWFFRHYDKHHRAYQYAKERFLSMDWKERNGRSSAEILKELSREYINKEEE
jgi:predicted ATPase